MYEPIVVQLCESFIGSLAIIAIIVTALATMIGLVKAADTLRYLGTIVGIAIVLVLIVSVFVGLWSSMSLWRKVVAAAIVFVLWRLRRERHQLRSKGKDE